MSDLETFADEVVLGERATDVRVVLATREDGTARLGYRWLGHDGLWHWLSGSFELNADERSKLL